MSDDSFDEKPGFTRRDLMRGALVGAVAAGVGGKVAAADPQLVGPPVGQKHRSLRDQPDPSTQRRHVHLADRLPVEQHTTRGGVLEPVEHPQQRGLAGPAGANDGGTPARLDTTRNRIKQPNRSTSHGDCVESEAAHLMASHPEMCLVRNRFSQP